MKLAMHALYALNNCFTISAIDGATAKHPQHDVVFIVSHRPYDLHPDGNEAMRLTMEPHGDRTRVYTNLNPALHYGFECINDYAKALGMDGMMLGAPPKLYNEDRYTVHFAAQVSRIRSGYVVTALNDDTRPGKVAWYDVGVLEDFEHVTRAIVGGFREMPAEEVELAELPEELRDQVELVKSLKALFGDGPSHYAAQREKAKREAN